MLKRHAPTAPRTALKIPPARPCHCLLISMVRRSLTAIIFHYREEIFLPIDQRYIDFSICLCVYYRNLVGARQRTIIPARKFWPDSAQTNKFGASRHRQAEMHDLAYNVCNWYSAPQSSVVQYTLSFDVLSWYFHSTGTPIVASRRARLLVHSRWSVTLQKLYRRWDTRRLR